MTGRWVKQMVYKHCGNCEHTDGLVYTSLPPQVMCELTGEFHYMGDSCDANYVLNTKGIYMMYADELKAALLQDDIHTLKVKDSNGEYVEYRRVEPSEHADK